ncbi:MAG: hypothetical protein HRU17_01170 [Polyangiaceae bacterium]|nr:hypothetical protein [Polyangiaceae bacterium]
MEQKPRGDVAQAQSNYTSRNAKAKAHGPQRGVAKHSPYSVVQRHALLQRALKRANIDVVEEMSGLITAQRAYEVNSNVITVADEMLRTATNRR